ncbi:hypothetical protein C1645_774559, partial [Glomus cerebriforme]
MWKSNYDMHHTEGKWRNDIIENINFNLPGFKYLVNFHWRYNNDEGSYSVDDEIGDLIFGSDYGIYLVFEAKWLNLNSGIIAESYRKDDKIKVKECALKYRELARKRFNDNKVIGVSFTNDNEQKPINFVDNDDKMIIDAITNFENEQQRKLFALTASSITIGATLAFGVIKNIQKYS